MVIAAASVDSIFTTFIASLRSIGTAITMALTGYYLHRTDCIGTEGKRTLAVLSQQVTFPLFLFTKIIYCNQDWSDKPCPDVTKSLADVWMLLFWPIYVVGVGLLVGLVVAKTTRAPQHHVRSILAACAFANSTGLPITLLNVIHSNFPSTSDLGRIDPTLFLSVFLLTYPILQWGLGGYLLAPDEKSNALVDATLNNGDICNEKSSPFDQLVLSETIDNETTVDVLNIDVNNGHQYNTKSFLSPSLQKSRNLSSADESLYMSEHDLVGLLQSAESQVESERERLTLDNSFDNKVASKNGHHVDSECKSLLNVKKNPALKLSIWSTVKVIAERCFQPPVVGAIAGIICASVPRLRALFVDLVDRDGDAPLQFLFDGLYAIGTTAVPINMMILGCNLSSSSSSRTPAINTTMLSMRTMVGILIGKMVLMPFIGIGSAFLLKAYVWDIPEDIEGAFYLVLMIVFLTPTANNVIVMVELSGSGAKEGMARVIALQYLFAPIILSVTMTIAIGVASGWT